MDTVRDYYGIKEPAKIAGRKLNKSVLCGIEIELEQTTSNHPVTPWVVVQDNSLKRQGAEFTLCTWNTSAEKYLNDLFNALITKNPSSRCSVHIHANILDFTLDQIKVLLLLYMVYERPLFNFSGKRWTSNYCVPVQSYFIKQINDISMGNLEKIFPKYAAIHLLTEGKFGTAEFRHMVGNHNTDYIMTWINIIANLITYAQSGITYEELVKKLYTMHTDSSYWALGKEVFGEYYYALQYKDFQKDTELGVLFAKMRA